MDFNAAFAPGMLTTLLEFLDENPDPTEREVREAISGICVVALVTRVSLPLP